MTHSLTFDEFIRLPMTWGALAHLLVIGVIFLGVAFLIGYSVRDKKP